MKTIVFFLILAISNISFAKESIPELDDKNLATFMRGMDKGCRDQALKNGLSEEKSNYVCNCSNKVLLDSFSRQDWSEMAFYGSNHLSYEAEKKLAPYAEKLGDCFKN